jgi:hypothetical protein
MKIEQIGPVLALSYLLVDRAIIYSLFGQIKTLKSFRITSAGIRLVTTVICEIIER